MNELPNVFEKSPGWDLEVPGGDVQHQHGANSHAGSSSRGLVMQARLLERVPFPLHSLHPCPFWSWVIGDEDKFLKESRTKALNIYKEIFFWGSQPRTRYYAGF